MEGFGNQDGKTVTFEYRYAEGKIDLLPALAKELVDQNVKVIVAIAGESLVAAAKTTTTVPIVSANAGGDFVAMGLAKSWESPGGNVTGMNLVADDAAMARVETVETSASYRAAFKKRRCLIPADSFYEWKKAGTVKQPYAIGLESGEPFVFAGLWEGWPRPGTDEWLRTCTIITCEPNEFVATIHNRMPVILPEMHHEAWLSGEAGKHNLTPYPAEEMIAWPIDSRVNSPRNNDPAIVEPFG